MGRCSNRNEAGNIVGAACFCQSVVPPAKSFRKNFGNVPSTLPETNVAAENQYLEDESPFEMGLFLEAN